MKTTKSAKVYLADAADELMARWIISACRAVKKEVRKGDVLKLIRQISGQSGGQFPVLGIVYEDMNGTGVNTPYVFKDGVTVFPASVHIQNNTATAAQVDSCLVLKDVDLKTNSGVYGRICSTTREQYYRAGGKNDVGSSKPGQRKLSWLATVRTLYRQALKQDHNELITAWAKTNL